MMKYMLNVMGCIGLASAVVTTCAAAEEISKYDHRKAETDEGLFALFCSAPDGQGVGDAFVVLATGENPDSLKVSQAFGLVKSTSGPEVGAVAEDHVKAIREKDTTKTLAVRLDKAQYAAAEALMSEWRNRKDFIDDPDVVALNFCETLVLKLEMKKPFRPVLSRANPHVYFSDLTKLNRNKVPH